MLASLRNRTKRGEERRRFPRGRVVLVKMNKHAHRLSKNDDYDWVSIEKQTYLLSKEEGKRPKDCRAPDASKTLPDLQFTCLRWVAEHFYPNLPSCAGLTSGLGVMLVETCRGR